MDGYNELAESYQHYIERNPNDPNRHDIEAKIKYLHFLGQCTPQDISFLYDTSVFNKFTRAYCQVAMQNCEVPEEMISDVMAELRYLHDMVPSGKIDEKIYHFIPRKTKITVDNMSYMLRLEEEREEGRKEGRKEMQDILKNMEGNGIKHRT